MKAFRKPDLNAPRFRPCRLNLLNAAFCRRLRTAHPRLAHLSDAQIKGVVTAVNKGFWQAVVEHRDGVELPQQLGYIFIGSCPRKKKDNTDYHRSARYGYQLQHQNWESDQYTAKIFYTNYETKYHFRFHELWCFDAHRDFSRAVAHSYPHNWKRYMQVDNMQHVSRLFRAYRRRAFQRSSQEVSLEGYDEFEL